MKSKCRVFVLFLSLTVFFSARGFSQNGTWTTKAPMPTARLNVSAAAVNGRLYAIGGNIGGNQTDVGTNEAYDPSSDTWTTKAPLPASRQGGNNIAVANGIIYLVGGTPPGFCTNEADAYNPATDTWTVLAPMSTSRCGLTVVALNGLVYAIGGTNTNGSIKYSTMEVYDPTTSAWSTGPSMLTGREYAGGAAINGKIYVVGGWAGPDGVDQSDTHNTQGGYLAQNEVYDPVANSWSTAAPMPTIRGNFGTGVINGALFAVGGQNDSGILSTVEAYDPARNAWTTQPAVTTARAFLGSDVINGVLYAVGGSNSSGPVATNEAFALPSITVTNTSNNGAGSLRNAIALAASGDTINFSLTTPATITLSGVLVISKNLTISGPGAANLFISGNSIGGVFYINPGVTVNISGVTIEQGKGGYPGGGGIYNDGTLSLSDSTVSGNSAGFNNSGGGIYNDHSASATLTNSTVTGNSTDIYGGGIYNDGTLTLTNSTVSLNGTGQVGGGIFNDQSGSATLTNSTVSGNSAYYYGGGIYNIHSATLTNSIVSGNSNDGIFNDYNRATSTTLTLTNSTVSGNTANNYGGGIVNYYFATLTLINSTVSGNTVTTGVNRGGGIWSTNHGSVTVTNSTISGNSNTAGSQGGGGIYSDSQASVTVTNSTISGNTAGSQGGGGIFYSGATLTLKSTILANNGSVNCFLYSGATGITDGYNLSDDNSCSNILTSRTDSNNTPAGLNPAGLQDNGGPTKTTALLSTSPAVDAIPVANCSDVNGPLTTDQRGITRPQGSACDIGAFELAANSQATQTITVTGPSSVTYGATGTATSSGSSGTGAISFSAGSSTGCAVTGTTVSVSDASGSCVLAATIAADNNYTTATSAPFTVTLSKATQTITISCVSPQPILGQSVQCSASVAPTSSSVSIPTGSVTFFDGGNSIGTAQLNNTNPGGGPAVFNTPPFSSAGQHLITAQYAGDTNFSGSTTASPTTVSVQKDSVVLGSLNSSFNPSFAGNSVTFTLPLNIFMPSGASALPQITGSVTFSDGANVLGSTPVGASTPIVNGSPLISFTASFGPGLHVISATYSGDNNYTTSGAATLTQTVNKVPTTVSLTPNIDPSVAGQALTLTAMVGPQGGPLAPSGTVTFKDGSAPLGTAPVGTGGAAVLLVPFATAGSHLLTATYNGDANFVSSSSSLTQTVNKDATTLVVSSSLNPSPFGQPMTFTATVSANAPGGGTPSGSVTVSDEGGGTGIVNLAGGTGSVTIFPLTAGSQTITASYSGDANYNGSSGSTVLTIIKATQTITVNGPSAVNYGTTGTATSTGSRGTGAISFSAGSSTGCAVTGTTVSVSNATGTCVLTATIAADNNYAAATSVPFTVTIGQATSSVTVSCPTTAQTYTGSALTPCTAAYKTSDGLSAASTVSYTNNTSVGTAGASAS